MKRARYRTQAWMVSVAALALAGGLAGCAAEEAPDADAVAAEDELRLFPDPRCRGPIEMSKRTYAPLPQGYEALSAAEKQSALWQNLSSTPYVADCRPSSGAFLAALAATSTLVSFPTTMNHSSDEIPAGRRKMLHPFGTVATFDFVKDEATEGAPAYTGMLAPETGPVKGVLRASLGGDPNVLGFTPGVAVKFLIDGKPSINVVVMHSLMGQGRDTNFFRHAFTNEVPEPHTGVSRLNFLEWVKADGFAFVTNTILIPAMARGPEERNSSFLRVDHVAMRSPDGSIVPEADRRHPSHLVLRAPQRVVEFADQSALRNVDYRDMFERIGAGTVLYEVYGRATPSAPETRIGVIKTTSPFVSSIWGDYRLFFRHNDHQNNEDVGR